jgi:hypothetical protein
MSAAQFIVRYRHTGGIPAKNLAIKFHGKQAGRMFSLVKDSEASRFDTKIEAASAAVCHNLFPGNFKIEEARNVSA